MLLHNHTLVECVGDQSGPQLVKRVGQSYAYRMRSSMNIFL